MSKPHWTRSHMELLEGSNLAIVPTFGGAWYVINPERPWRALTVPLTKRDAKRFAEKKAARAARQGGAPC